MAKQLISRTEFAKLAGCSPANITKLCSTTLKPAVTGKMIDVSHPAASGYLESRTGATTKPATKTHVRGTHARQQKRQQQSVADEFAPIDPTENIGPYLDMTLREILSRFGTQPAFEAWLNSAKKLEDIREKRLKNETSEGRLVDREFVEKHIIAYIDASNERLLSDAPTTLVARVGSGIRAKRSEQELVGEASKIIGDQIKAVKGKVLRSLRSA